ncbi:O-antigen ligase family protein [Methylorubrum extorquens]|uniref:O-antigen ligase family protein n=1 Tax=Methylorubrum extorquens TaxID=408 RepID=UPI00209D3599|nr:O-antigen ligase family protein [Methylorubrum extorquens]MCP1538651.1 O-antigen ligase [Methylorubrum extorquens]
MTATSMTATSLTETSLPPNAVRTAPSSIGLSGARWRAAFVVFAVLMCANAFYVLFLGSNNEVGNTKTLMPSNRNNLLYVGLWLCLYVLSLGVVLRDMRRNGIDLCLVAVLPFAGYILLSTCWATDSWASLVPAGMLVLNISIAAALACIVHPAVFLSLYAWTNVFLVASSLVMVVVMPDAVRTDITRPGLLMSGELFGAYGSKTLHGMSAASAMLILLFLPSASPRGLRGPALGILALGLILANSMSSVSGIAVAGLTLLAARMLPGCGRAIFATVTGFAILLSLFLPFIGVGDIAVALGRSPDFTGRSNFWPYALEVFRDRPVFGYGYLSFFNTDPFSKAWNVWEREMFFFTPDFHNTFLDTLVGLGLVGGAFYLVLLLASSCIFAHPSLERRTAFLLSALLIAFILNSATGYLFLAHNRMSTIFQFYCLFVLCRRYRPRFPQPAVV